MIKRLILASLLATTIAAASGRAEAFELKHTASGRAVRWRVADVSFTIDASVREIAGAEDAASAAVAAWGEHAGAPSLAVAETGAPLKPGLDGTNAVFFAEEGFAPAGNALAVTILSFDDRTGDVLDADVVVNGKYPFVSFGRGATHAAAVGDDADVGYDIRRVLAHEMGHALGLSDEPALKTALMYPYVARGAALSTSPADDDRAGLTSLYGSVASADLAEATVTEGPPSAGGATSGCAVVAAPRSPRGHAAIYVAVGLTLAALAAARDARRARARRGAAGCTLFAAAALFAAPVSMPVSGERRPAPPAVLDARATVTAVHTTFIGGLFRSEVDVTTTACGSRDCPASSRIVTWGGTIDHVQQVVGEAYVPELGEAVGLVVEHGTVRAIARLDRR